MVGNTNLAASIASARGNLSKSANKFFSVADQIEERFKELEKKESEMKVMDEQMAKKMKELVDREKKCEEREQKINEREREVGEKEAKWVATEQQMVLNASKIPSIVSLNVGGKVFMLPKSDLLAHKGSYFESMILTQHSQQLENGMFFIDRDRDCFEYVFQFLKNGKFNVKENIGDVAKEFQFFKLPCPRNLLLKGELISDAHQQVINMWLPKKQFVLLYKATVDGFGATDFHKLCDNKGPTLTVICSNTYLFGAYASIPWNSDNKWKPAPESFMFTLTNPHGVPPTKYVLRSSDASAMCDKPERGPSFGSGCDIHVASNSNAHKGSFFNFNDSYVDTTGKGQETFTGARNFTSTEIEVYSVNKIPTA